MARYLYAPINWITVLHGSIVELNDFDKNNLSSEQFDWFDADIKQYKTCKFYDIKDFKFKLAFLDSSEFCGFSEFKKIENMCEFVILDDTNPLLSRKHVETRKYCLDVHECIVDKLEDRNGWSLFKMKGAV